MIKTTANNNGNASTAENDEKTGLKCCNSSVNDAKI